MKTIRNTLFILTLLLGVCQANAATNIYYVHNDHLGTPKAMTDANQAVVWKTEHTPFGVSAVDEDPDGDSNNVVMNVRFPGQYYDQETNLHYNWNRYYDPNIGRYITSDRIGLDGGNNTYGYALQNPIGYYDPNGSESIRLGGPSGAGFSIAAPLIKRLKLGLSLGGGFVVRRCCDTDTNQIYNEFIVVADVGISLGASIQSSASGKGNIGLLSFGPYPECVGYNDDFWSSGLGTFRASGGAFSGSYNARIGGGNIGLSAVKGASISASLIKGSISILPRSGPLGSCDCES